MQAGARTYSKHKVKTISKKFAKRVDNKSKLCYIGIVAGDKNKNACTKGAKIMKIKTWNIEAQTGYKPRTTFYEDFSIADAFGVDAVKDTYKRGIKNAKFMGYKDLTEFVMVLNWKIWEHYNTNDQLATVYNDLWQKAVDFAFKHLKGEELQYYIRTTD